VLEEDELQRVLDVLVDRVKQTAGLGAGPTDVLEALRQDGIEIVGTGVHHAGDDYQRRSLQSGRGTIR
jgi:hypothetical protein